MYSLRVMHTIYSFIFDVINHRHQLGENHACMHISWQLQKLFFENRLN